MKIHRTNEEIEGMYQRAWFALYEGGTHPELTYEDGILKTIDWLLEENEEEPIDSMLVLDR
jgi:hypothetical protein